MSAKGSLNRISSSSKKKKKKRLLHLFSHYIEKQKPCLQHKLERSSPWCIEAELCVSACTLTPSAHWALVVVSTRRYVLLCFCLYKSCRTKTPFARLPSILARLLTTPLSPDSFFCLLLLYLLYFFIRSPYQPENPVRLGWRSTPLTFTMT